ncbi:MAG: hypothetical protein H6728_09485 [Myxococcales bacterium]|nr:hypothetical protein [Myxococcales bacterium]
MTEQTQPPKKRHPLGLPRGSVRAILALSIFGSVMALLLLERLVPQGLWLVNYTILGYYFTMRRGNDVPTAVDPEASPLHLPRGTVRWLLLLGFAGTAAWLVWQQVQHSKAVYEHAAFFPMCSLASFFLGLAIRGITPSKEGSLGRLIGDVRAFLAIAAAAIVVMVSLFNLQFPGATVATNMSLIFIFFYFGSR